MIVELFGPPGSGKTTFARALNARLREHGHDAELILSYRPGEGSPGLDARPSDPMMPHWTAAAMLRMGRPVVEMLSLACRPRAVSHDVATALKLVRLLPPSNVIWSIRLAQYLARLSHSWCRASAADHIVLFDQAFVQAVSSLVLLGRGGDEPLLAQALDCVPKPDFLIRLDAPEDVLETRLRDRGLHQGAIERLFESDIERNLRSARIIDRLDEVLRRRGRKVIRVNSLDRNSLTRAVRRIERKLIGAVGETQRGAA
jgi:thymidylate kinase